MNTLPFEIQCEILIYSPHFRCINKAFNNEQYLFKKVWDRPITINEIKRLNIKNYIIYSLEEDYDHLPRLYIEIVGWHYRKILLNIHYFMGYRFTHYTGFNHCFRFPAINRYYDIKTTLKVYQSRNMKHNIDMSLLTDTNNVWDVFKQLTKIWTVNFEWHAIFGSLYLSDHDFAANFNYITVDFDKIKLELDYENKRQDITKIIHNYHK